MRDCLRGCISRLNRTKVRLRRSLEAEEGFPRSACLLLCGIHPQVTKLQRQALCSAWALGTGCVLLQVDSIRQQDEADAKPGKQDEKSDEFRLQAPVRKSSQ